MEVGPNMALGGRKGGTSRVVAPVPFFISFTAVVLSSFALQGCRDGRQDGERRLWSRWRSGGGGGSPGTGGIVGSGGSPATGGSRGAKVLWQRRQWTSLSPWDQNCPSSNFSKRRTSETSSLRAPEQPRTRRQSNYDVKNSIGVGNVAYSLSVKAVRRL
jgi:hypothetical protein